MVVAEIYPLDFWNIFVVQVFGGFWPAVIGLMLIYFIILIMGKVSIYSVINIMLAFLVCMVLGYGYILVSVPLIIIITIRFIYDVMGVIARARA